MPHCFVPGCKTNYPSSVKRYKLLGLKNPSVFKVPKDPEILKEWKRKIPRCNREFTYDDHICELHFSEDVIDKYYITKLPDGTVSKIERGRWTLKPGAIPHYFLNASSCVSKEDEKREKPAIYNPIDIKVAIKKENPVSHTIQDENITRKYNLAVESIKVPNQWWGVCSTPQFIVCTKWDAAYFPERRVFMKRDLSAKVYLKNQEIRTDEMLKISSGEDISRLLLEVDRYQICTGIDNKSVTDCMGYLPQKRSPKRVIAWCKSCQIYNRRRQRKVRTVNKFKKMQDLSSCAVKKNSLLKQKVSKLEKTMSALLNKCETDDVEAIENMIKPERMEKPSEIGLLSLATMNRVLH